MNYKILAVIILSIIYGYGMVLSVIGRRSVYNPVPDNVRDVYDTESYRKWQTYYKEKNRLGMVTLTVHFIVGLVLLILNVYAAFAGLFPDTLFLQMLAVILVPTVSDIITLPFSYYDTMGIEERYGFNRTTKKTFWLDQIKGYLVGVILMLAVGSLLLWLHQSLGPWLILAFAGAMMVLVLVIVFLYPVFRKLFNKFTPLEDEELAGKLAALMEKHNYHVRAIRVMDASKRTTKANAYFSGFGRMKTIVLYDTLLETMTTEEICAVFAHELGHGLHKDTLRNQILSFFQMLIIGVLALLTLETTDIYGAFGFSSVNYGFALILILEFEMALISPLFGLVINSFSRKAEYRADQQAVQEGYGETLISALKKLASRDFANISPDPLLVKLEYSHPTLSQRIDAIRNPKEGK